MEVIKPGINIDFVGRRRWAYLFSISLIIMTVVALIARGGPNYGVDFAGGILVQVKFEKPTTAKDVRAGLADLKMSNASIQSFGENTDNEFLIRVQESVENIEGLSKQIGDALTQKYGKGAVEIRRVEMVGPKVGEDLRQKALYAIFYSILFMLIYISGRFELKWAMSAGVAAVLMGAVYVASLIGTGITWLILLALLVTLVVCFIFQLKYALGAIVALIHDITITVGVFALLNKEIDLTIVAALLTILGYSINDTIIVFDRIRENVRKDRKKNFELNINSSINETLSRTILTSGTTLMVTLCLLFLGGPVISNFALALTVGIGIGTYSSIFVASPILMIWPPQGAKPKGKK